MTLWTNFFLNYGGEFLDAKGNILTDGPEAIEATKLYQTLLTKVAPPGVAGFNWMESMAAFTQGTLGDVDRRRRLGAAAGRSGRLAHRRQGRLRHRAGGAEGTIFGDLSATASASRRRARTRKPPICSANGRSRRRRARGCCKPAAACRSATRCSTIAEVRKGVKLPAGVAAIGDRLREDQQARPAGHHPGRRVPRPRRRRLTATLSGADPAAGAEEGARAVPADPGAQRKGVSATSHDRPARAAAGQPRRQRRMAAAVLLAVRAAGADRRARRHRVSVGVHDLDEPERMEGRLADHLRRPRQLPAAAERSALRRGGRAHALSTPRSSVLLPLDLRHVRRRGVPRQLSAARLAARRSSSCR